MANHKDRNGTKLLRCGSCKARYPSRMMPDGRRASGHHMIFTSDALKEFPELSQQMPLSEQRRIILLYRSSIYKVTLCQKNHGSNDGCHDRFNTQIKFHCCGIQNIPSGKKSRVLIGICPLISGKKPVDPELILPNQFCEFCFFFHAIANPTQFMPLMEFISILPTFDGEVTPQMLEQAKDSLQKRGIRLMRIDYQAFGQQRVRWRPRFITQNS